MDVLGCGHPAHASENRLCRHLAGSEDDLGYYRVLRGDGLRSDLVCVACEERRAAGRPVDLVVSCEGCVERRLDDPWEQRGWRGAASIAERPEPLRVVDAGRFDVPPPVSDQAISPTAAGWVTLSADGRLTVTDGAERTSEVRIELPVVRAGGGLKPPRLAVHTGRDGRQAAIVVDYGSAGTLVDTRTGTVLRRIDRGDYHPEQTPFPCAFADAPTGSALIAATDWNRLDVFDAATGQLLTARESPRYTRDPTPPPHYLGYFHGALYVSPGGRWIVDDGWIWHPVGMPRSWSVERWLSADVWESEDGESCVRLRQVEYHWDSPVCWLDERRVVLWGIGTDDEDLVAGVTVVDVRSGAQVSQFAGPAGSLFCDGRRLYAADGGELTVWDPLTGDRTAVIRGLDVVAHNRDLGEFVVRRTGGLDRVRLA